MGDKYDANDILRDEGPEGVIHLNDRAQRWRPWAEEDPQRNGSDAGPPPPHDDPPPLPPPRERLLLATWLNLVLPARDWLFEGLMCTTSRWLLFGDTGVGKTLFNLPMAAAAAAGADFLDWKGGRKKRRVIYLDGEMPAETAKERLEIVARRYGDDLPLWFYNRDLLRNGAMPPLNSEDGEKWLMREIEAVKPDFIVFDSIMSLLAGSMSDAENWAPIILLMRRLTSKRVAQTWMHHTGHDTTRSYGDKTREWQLDTVARLTASGEGEGDPITLDFTKARLRTPETRRLYAPKLIVCGPDGWTVQGLGAAKGKGRKRSDHADDVRAAILAAYDRLADGVTPSPGFDGASVLKVKAETVREAVRDRGFLATKDTGGVTEADKKTFLRAKTSLIARHVLIEAGGFIWRLYGNPK
jgi:hypothetical protein